MTLFELHKYYCEGEKIDLFYKTIAKIDKSFANDVQSFDKRIDSINEDYGLMPYDKRTAEVQNLINDALKKQPDLVSFVTENKDFEVPFTYTLSDYYSDDEIIDFFKANPECHCAYGLVWLDKDMETDISCSGLSIIEDTTIYASPRSLKVSISNWELDKIK